MMDLFSLKETPYWLQVVEHAGAVSHQVKTTINQLVVLSNVLI